MVVNFSNIDFSERPILILKNASDTPLGVLGYAKNVAVDLKYNETSSIEFEVPGFVNGEETPFYNDIAGMRTLEIQGIGQFTLISPSENGDGVQKTKSCKGYSLEYEFVYKKITLPENTYKFWDELNPSGTLLGMIMELMPSWSIGSVSTSLLNKYRTFEVNNENLYNLIKGTVQKAYNCIFDFDTMNRRVYVRDASDTPSSKPVFISLSNLAKEIEITENTEDIFTRLDVNGTEGVTIRDVNPTGTNKIINLDYYMTDDNFSPELIEKYYAWKQLYADNKRPYYSLSVQYAVKTAQKITEYAKLTDLQGEMTSLENLQAVAIQSIAQGIGVQNDLDKANADIAAKQSEINAKQSEIDVLQDELSSIFNQLKAITEACSFENYFTASEYRLLDRYIKDGEISESSFVVAEVSSYESEGNGKKVGSISVSFSNCTITHITTAGGSRMYDIKGGEIEILGDLKANVVSAIVERQTNGSFVATAYLSSGTIAGNSFPSACVSLTGDGGSITSDATSAIVSITNGYRYFTLDASEYEKRSVAWDLYEFGEEVSNKMAAPSYSFSITSANFLALEEFVTFKNALTLGEKVYIDMGDRGILQPIAIGVKFTYDDPESMDLLFADTYTSGDSTFRLIDLLEQSISMGKNVEMSKYIYSSFVDSGASTGLKEFMTSALDVAKNAIMSSTNQAISWDGAGFRLRKWTNDSHTAYEPEQIWMNNNSIVMTDDNWATAQMAIGKFHDENLGDCWGIVAPRIVGTLLAGGSLVIESAKRDGGVAQFRVDGDGCRIYNSDISVSGDKSHIILNPEIGFAIGAFPVYTIDEKTGTKTLDENNAKFWADTDGNLHFKGTLNGANGDFTGNVSATSLTILGTPVDEYVDNRAEDIASPIRDSLNDLIDTVDGETVIYYSITEPNNVNNKDIWYNTSNDVIKRYVDGKWVDITDTTLGLSLKSISDAQATADGKIITFAQASQPTAAAIGDLWIDTDDKNKLYRWDGSKWVEYRDKTIADAQAAADNAKQEAITAQNQAGAAQKSADAAQATADAASSSAAAARSFADSVYNGVKGIYFSSSSVSELALNTSVGLKITGSDGTYFQVKNDAMGFFRKDGTAMLYYENGSVTLSGIIAAHGGYIGGSGGWVIGTNCIYNGGASSLGASNGIYLGNSGISVGSAITMKPDGSFIIRGDNTSSSDSNYVLKIVPSVTEDGDTVYKLCLGNITFDDSFVLPPSNGGTGGTGRDDVGSTIGIYRVTSAAEMANLQNSVNGDLCILSSEGSEGVYVSGAYLTSTTTSPGFLAIGSYSAAGHRYTSYFDISGIAYWNIANLSGESVSSSYARVGVGHTVSGACGLYVPLKISASGAVTSVTITFNFATRPANCTRDLCSSWSNGIHVSLYKGNSSVKVAMTTYMMPDAWKVASSTLRTATVTLNSSSGITSGEYYVAFYTNSTYSLMWIQPASVSIAGKSVGSVDGLYLRSGNIWKSIASSENYGVTYVLPAASTSALGGVKIGTNINLGSDGTISLTKDNIVNALGFTPGSGSSDVSISNRLTSGTRIVTLTVDGTAYDIYSPSSSVSISNRLTSGTRIATLSISGTSYDLYAPATSGGTVSGDYVPLSGGTMTGNLIISGTLYPSIKLTPTYNNSTYVGVVEGSYAGSASLSIYDDSSGNNRRMIEVRSAKYQSSLDDAVVLRTAVDSSYSTYRIFHSGMTSAGAKAALNCLGIYYSATKPVDGSGADGQICLVPVA